MTPSPPTARPSGAIPFEAESLQHDFRAELSSELGVLTLEFVTLSPSEISSEDGQLGENWSDWNWHSKAAKQERTRSDGPATYFASLTEWRLSWLGVYSWARSAYHVRVIEVPYWLVAVFFGLPGAFVVWRWWGQGRRRRAGRCVACGYDLRGGGDVVACPECGRAS